MKNRVCVAFFWALVGLAFAVEPAWAYLDPGTGSLILQGLTAGVAGVLMVGKLYFSRLKSFLPGGSRVGVEAPVNEADPHRTGETGRTA